MQDGNICCGISISVALTQVALSPGYAMEDLRSVSRLVLRVLLAMKFVVVCRTKARLSLSPMTWLIFQTSPVFTSTDLRDHSIRIQATSTEHICNHIVALRITSPRKQSQQHGLSRMGMAPLHLLHLAHNGPLRSGRLSRLGSLLLQRHRSELCWNDPHDPFYGRARLPHDIIDNVDLQATQVDVACVPS